MGGNKRPSFLKRQKELQRVARATQKREDRRQKKRSPGSVMDESGEAGGDLVSFGEEGEDMVSADPTVEGGIAEEQ
ncbi:MAG: hypothetical protein ABIS67_01805 [Candidatus Eisenbacteria bacterium]